MRIEVDCSSDGLRRFVLGERTIEVTALLDRWFGDEVDYFRVQGPDGDVYVLKHVRGHDRWELTSFTRSGSRGGVAATLSRGLH